MRYKSLIFRIGNVLLFGLAGVIGLEHLGLDVLGPLRTRVTEVRQLKEANRDLLRLHTDDQALGASDGLDTLLMFTDYQCPFCRQQEYALDSLLERVRDLRIVVQHFPLPFHAQARPAAAAAICAGRQGRFSKAHRILYDQVHLHASLDVAALVEVIDVPMREDYEACLSDPAITRHVDTVVAIAQRLGVRGTPAFMIHGQLYRGLMSTDALHAALTRRKH